MSNIAKTTTATPAKLESVVIEGDLAHLSPQERLTYYRNVCESVGLNPLTKPFQYLRLSGKLVLYCSKDATDQLRKLHGVSIRIVARERLEDCWIVTAEATDSTGRTDASIGAVGIAGLKGDALANALMKAETKAKRRVTLSISGLGMLDETEIETIPAAVRVDDETGEIEPNLEPKPEPETDLYALRQQVRDNAKAAGFSGDAFLAIIKSVKPSGKLPE
jgi:hypothetical protein